MIIESYENEKIKKYKKLHQKKYRDEFGLFLVEGEHLVDEANKLGYLIEVLSLNNTSYEYTNVTFVTEKILKYLSQLDNPSNIIGICKKKENNLEIGNNILVLDGIQDPGNLGAIIRSCVAFNVDTLVLSLDTVDEYNNKVIRATQGLIFELNIVRTDILEFLTNLDGYKIYGTDVLGGKSLKNIENIDKSVIIMGNEGTGLKKEVKELCDEFIYIEMNDRCESLNVAVATSIILYNFYG